jgi:MmyB-like transcription regulator ligand binding domain
MRVLPPAPVTAVSGVLVFLDPASPDFDRDWEQLAEHVVALLRGKPYDRDLTDLIGELSTRSERFRTRRRCRRCTRCG